MNLGCEENTHGILIVKAMIILWERNELYWLSYLIVLLIF